MIKTDIEIAQNANMLKITEVAKKAGIDPADLEPYGSYKAKINYSNIRKDKKGKLILVTAISPTPAGEGKTTTTVGLGDALTRLNHNCMIVLREPSLGPVFGVKGGAAGGGFAQIVPMEDINLHFTGDFHAIGAANNLLAAILDNHIHQGNALNIDTRRITWRRCVDMNDRQLRNIVSGLGGKTDGLPREDGFDITVASEIMAVLCLCENIADLKSKLSNMVVAYDKAGNPVTARMLKAEGAMAALLKDAIKPNLVQSLENTPAIVHGGPFANIAHGCSSVIAAKTALCLSDYVVTEAGFGADLGAEKFFDIKCRKSGLKPDAVVIVATVRALKHHGGAQKAELSQENTSALKAGIPNLLRHLKNITEVFGLPAVVAINRFPTDTERELALVKAECARLGVNVVLSEVWEKGGAGGTELAAEVVKLCKRKNNFRLAYSDSEGIRQKIEAVATKVYGGKNVVFLPQAEKELEKLNQCGFGDLPVCIAKTQYSFSDDPQKRGAPENFDITVRKLKVSAGAGFVVVLTGDIMTMPGLPLSPAAEKIDVDDDGTIKGLF